MPCGGNCSAGYYKSSDGASCLQCDASPCPLGTFRGPCGAQSDSQCFSCGSLLNPSVTALNATRTRAALWSADAMSVAGAPALRWLPW